ncbi:hypothetical protein PT282_01335 [Bifidobacterium sp. ESL0763]|uniref:hypothetical protein n=1 Tax=Bifidobacterium sp. ESL0763 TaxID=2983227 RepID=UPI0023F9CFBD|nr:hypothetical protein [Bifidobacterium sp. ESL0763]MDF7663325.1 hypothetical protein [Bifidobacterium sp. ESL0763]
MTSIHHEPQKANAKPTRRASVMRGIVAPILGLLAVASLVLGVLNATVWKPSPEITASGQVQGTRYIVTDPGVLNLVDDAVDLKVGVGGHARKSKVCVALASSKDAAGWVAGHSYTRVTGLGNWTTLASKVSQAGADSAGRTSDGDVAFKDSDMWRQVRCGASGTSLSLRNVDDGEVAIIDLKGGEAPAKTAAHADKKSHHSAKSDDASSVPVSLSMHWVRHTASKTPYVFYGLALLFAILTALAASVLAMEPKRLKRMLGLDKHKRKARKAEPVSEEVTISEAMTGSFQALGLSLKRSDHTPTHTASHIASVQRTGGAEAGAMGDEGASGTPNIIDPLRRNMVASLQASNAGDIGASGTGTAETGTDAVASDSLRVPDLAGASALAGAGVAGIAGSVATASSNDDASMVSGEDGEAGNADRAAVAETDDLTNASGAGIGTGEPGESGMTADESDSDSKPDTIGEKSVLGGNPQDEVSTAMNDAGAMASLSALATDLGGDQDGQGTQDDQPAHMDDASAAQPAEKADGSRESGRTGHARHGRHAGRPESEPVETHEASRNELQYYLQRLAAEASAQDDGEGDRNGQDGQNDQNVQNDQHGQGDHESAETPSVKQDDMDSFMAALNGTATDPVAAQAQNAGGADGDDNKHEGGAA